MNKEKRKHGNSKVYKLEGILLWNRVSIMAILAIGLLVFLFMLNGREVPNDLAMMNIVMITMIAIALYFIFFQVAQSHITMYEDGLEWQWGDTKLYSRWDNLSTIEKRGFGRTTRFGIRLHEKVEVEARGIENLIHGYRETDFINFTGLILVPTRWVGIGKGAEVDLEKFADTEFGQDLMHYAPQLFEKEKLKHELSDDSEGSALEDGVHYDNISSQDLEEGES